MADTKFFLGQYETRNFTFSAISRTEEGLKKAIRKGWKKHCKQTGADDTLFNVFDIRVAEMKLDECLRDMDTF